MKQTRPPGIYVITDVGKHPAFIKGTWIGGLIIAFTESGGIFLINPVTQKLVTFAGTELDIEFEKCKTDIWECFDEQQSTN